MFFYKQYIQMEEMHAPLQFSFKGKYLVDFQPSL